jgi:hypothetical protein
MLLPNTEKFYVSWRKALTTLLVFYPLFSILFGGSYLAGMIIIGSASTNGADTASGMTVLIGMTITILPLWLTPLIARFSTGILSQVAGIVNNKSKGLVDRTRKVRDRKGRLAMGETFGSSKAKAARNPFSRVYRRMQNSSQVDADRGKVVENNNKAAYLTSTPGATMAYKTDLANQKVEAASTYNKARFEESKSTSQAIPTDHELATEIQVARDTQQEIDINHNRVSSAKSVLQQELATELSTRPGMAFRAGGIDPRGQSRVVASANAVIADAESKAISAEKSTMTRLSTTDLTGGLDLNTIMRDSSASAERRAAAAGQIMKVGADSDIHNTLDYLSTINGTPEGITIQQQASADIGNRKPLSIGAADMTALGRGQYTGTFDTKVGGRLLNGKISAEGINSASTDELDRYISVIPTLPVGHVERTRLKTAIANYKTSPTYRAPASEVVTRINNIETLL